MVKVIRLSGDLGLGDLVIRGSGDQGWEKHGKMQNAKIKMQNDN
jgi:hypothetical protein